MNLTAASLPPLIPKDITPQEPFGRYFCANSCWLSFSKPENETQATLGCFSQCLASARAFTKCLSILKCKVSSPTPR